MAKKKKAKTPGDQVFEVNRKARHDYEIVQTFEAGIALAGSEVKSIRDGKVSLKEAFCQFKNDELFLHQAHIAEYTMAHARNHITTRARKLLLHRKELDKLDQAVKVSGMTIIPLSVYLKNRYIKVEIGLAKGMKQHDKRHAIKAREQKREMDRAKKGDHG